MLRSSLSDGADSPFGCRSSLSRDAGAEVAIGSPENHCHFRFAEWRYGATGTEASNVLRGIVNDKWTALLSVLSTEPLGIAFCEYPATLSEFVVFTGEPWR